MSTLIESVPSGQHEEQDAEYVKGVGNLKSDILYRALLVTTGIFFVIFAVLWSGVVFAFGAGWYSLLTSMLCFTMARNIARDEVGVYKLRDSSKAMEITTYVAMFVTFISFLLLCIRPPVNYPERALKPIFTLISFFALQGFYFVLIRAPTVPNPQEDMWTSFIESSTFARISQMNKLEKQEVPDKLEPEKIEKAIKCRECCRVCCTFFLLFLVFWAGITVMVLFRRTGLYFEDANQLFAQSSLTNSEETMNFRCSGTGEPLVLLFHGYTGQALDMEHFKLAYETSTTVCSFSRSGYGLSQVFGSKKRISENFAIELDTALSNLDIDANKTSNLVLIGHSMAGFNMRAFDKLFPGRVEAMVLVDPVAPELTNDCFDDGLNINSPYFEGGARLVDMGVGVVAEMLGVHYLLAPIDALPKSIQTQYIADVYRAGYFFTSAQEGINWGETCEFIIDHTATYPVTVLIAEQGIYVNGLIDEAQSIQDFSSNVESRTINITGSDAGHTEAIFELKFAQVAIDAGQEYIDNIKADLLG